MAIEINMHQLYVFYMVGKHKRVYLAAEELHLTPSAVSMQIKKLEQWLGFKLFERKKTTLEFSEFGEELFRKAQKIFYEVDALDAFVAHIRHQQKATLLLGMHSTPAQSYIQPILHILKKHGLPIDLSMVLGNFTNTMQRLRHREIHVALAGMPQRYGDIHAQPLLTLDPVFAVAHDNELAQHDVLNVAAFTHIPLLLEPENPFTLHLQKYFASHRVTPYIAKNNISSTLGKKLIQTTELGSFYNKFFIQDDIALGKMRTVQISPPIPPYTTYLLCLKEQKNEMPIKQFFEAMQCFQQELEQENI